jgi:hypothetical protein
MSQAPASTSADPSAPLVRAELEAILSSELFTRSDRLSAFLRFIVEETLAGRGASLKEPVIAMALYGKGADYNTALDPIVRVDARRLRDKLREYYAAAPREPLVISVPKGSYTPLFEANVHGSSHPLAATAVEPAASVPVGTRRRLPAAWVAATAVLLLAGRRAGGRAAADARAAGPAADRHVTARLRGGPGDVAGWQLRRVLLEARPDGHSSPDLGESGRW